MDRSSPSATESVSEVSGALVPRTAEMSADIYQLIVREIPQLRNDKRVLTLLEASVAENVATMLHILQHGIDLENVRAPAAAEEYARRLAQRGIPVSALLRAYRIGSARFQDWCLQELGRHTDNASIISAAGLAIAGITASYIDRVAEEVLSAYESEKENWLRNQSAARAARVRALLRNEPVDVSSSEAILGYRLRQHHLGVVTWVTGAALGGDSIGRLERATAEMAAGARCDGRPIFVPQDEFSAWAWLPLGVRRDIAVPGLNVKAIPGGDMIRFAVGEPAPGVPGFRRTHQQALSAQAVALAAGPSGQPVTSFGEIAPLALMSGSIELLQAWVVETLGALADDDDHNARLRDTLQVFLQENGSYKTTAERLMLHKNTVQYRVRKAEESLGRSVGENRLNVELALLASQWLGAAVLQPARDSQLPPGVAARSVAVASAMPAGTGEFTAEAALPELIEAAIRASRRELASTVFKTLSERTLVAGTPWALGVRARCEALLDEGEDAEGAYLEAISQLRQSQAMIDLARTHLLYGQWLRRAKRRRDVRHELRTAHDMFAAMGADGLAERAATELRATGERASAHVGDNLRPHAAGSPRRGPRGRGFIE